MKSGLTTQSYLICGIKRPVPCLGAEIPIIPLQLEESETKCAGSYTSYQLSLHNYVAAVVLLLAIVVAGIVLITKELGRFESVQVIDLTPTKASTKNDAEAWYELSHCRNTQ